MKKYIFILICFLSINSINAQIFDDLKSSIDAQIFSNDDQLITGDILNGVLKEMCDEIELVVTGTITGNTEIDGDLHVTGNTDLDDTLNVDGVTILNSNLNVDAPASINGLLEVAGNAEITGALSAFSDLFVLGKCVTASNVPASASSPGTTGEEAWDATHYYRCIATNTWVRCTLATW